MSKKLLDKDLNHQDLVFGTEVSAGTDSNSDDSKSDEVLSKDLLFSCSVEPVDEAVEDTGENFSDDLIFKPEPITEVDEELSEDFSGELIYNYSVKPFETKKEPDDETKRKSINNFRGIIYNTKNENETADSEDDNVADEQMSEEFRKVMLDDVIDLIVEKIDNGGKVTFTPSGNSMYPLLRDSKDIVVLSKVPERLHLYDMVLYRRENGSYVLHRIVDFEGDGGYILCGDNQFKKERGIKQEAIIAVVSAFYRGGHQYSMDSLGYKLYVAAWMNTTVVRSIITRIINRAKRILIRLGLLKNKKGNKNEKKVE